MTKTIVEVSNNNEKVKYIQSHKSNSNCPLTGDNFFLLVLILGGCNFKGTKFLKSEKGVGMR